MVAAARFLVCLADDKEVMGKTLRELCLFPGPRQALPRELVKVPAGTMEYNRRLAPSLRA